MPEQQSSPYQRLSTLYETLPGPETVGSDTRSRTLADQARLSVTQIASAAQRAFIARLGKTSFYVSHEGLEWVSLPDLVVSVPVRQADVLGSTLLNIPVNPFSNVSMDNKILAADLLVKWMEDCIQENRLVSPPFKANFQLT